LSRQGNLPRGAKTGSAVGYVVIKMPDGVVVDPRSSGVVRDTSDADGALAKYL
jgi:hypothetical protein